MKSILCALALATLPAWAQPVPDDVRAAVEEVKRYDFSQPSLPLFALDSFTTRAGGNPAQQQAFAALLAAALADSNATTLARTIFCQKLALVGTDAEVPALAKLLGDPALSDPARHALEGQRSAAADEALRAALGRLDGARLAGVIHSLGNRRDAASVPALAKLLGAPDRKLAAAAAQALGKIATKEAASALAGSDFLDARLTCAQGLLQGNSDLPTREVAALAGSSSVAGLALLAQTGSPEAVEQLAQAARSSNQLVAASAIRFLGRIPGTPAGRVLTGLLADAASRDLVLGVLAERRDPSTREAVESLLDGQPEPTRIAALQALGSLGQSDTATKVAALLASDSPALRKAAEDAMAAMPDAGVDEVVRRGIASGTAPARAAMMRVATARRCANLDGLLLAAAAEPDAAVALEAIRALGRAGSVEIYPRVAGLLVSSPSAAARDAVAEALRDYRHRLPDPAARVAPLQALLVQPGLSADAAAAALGVLVGVGGPEALAAVTKSLASDQPAVRDAAVRALAKWADASALDGLVRLTETTTNETHRALALRGALRLAATAGDPAALLAKLEPQIRGADEKKLLLSALAGLPSLASLDKAAALLADKEVATESALAVVAISRTLSAAQPQRVSEALARVLGAQAAGPGADDARAILAALKGKGEAESARLLARENSLAGTLAAGDRVVGYLDCGTAPESRRPGGIGITVLGGQTYRWADGTNAAQAAAATVAYDHPVLHLRLDGLDAKKSYALHFTWWDYDAKGRKESVWIGAKRVIDPVELPAWQGKQQGPASLRCDVPAGAIHEGSLDLSFRAEGSDNALVSEIWLVERSAAPAAPGKHALIITGMEYPGHLWRETAPFLRDLIAVDPRMTVAINEDAKAALESPALGSNDVIILNYMNWQHPGPGAAAQENLRKAVENGTGLVLVHFACGAFQSWPEFVKMAGRVWNPKFRGHDARGPFQVNIVDAQHEITKGLSAFPTDDELYTCLDGDTPIHILADAKSKGDQKDYPMAFVLPYGKGRVFLCTLGHDVKALGFPGVKELYRRATAWAAGLPPEK